MTFRYQVGEKIIAFYKPLSGVLPQLEDRVGKPGVFEATRKDNTGIYLKSEEDWGGVEVHANDLQFAGYVE